MLNEKLEFDAYTKTPKSETPRIQPYYFTNSFSDTCELNGLEQILTVIARGILFSNHGIIEENTLNPKFIEGVSEILQRWCGFDETDYREEGKNPCVEQWFEKSPEADGWLKAYWTYHFNKGEKRKKTTLRAEDMWKQVKEKWQVSLCSSSDYRWKKITYHNVIANARELGPLRERYLVFRKDEKQKEVKEEVSFQYLYQVNGGGKPNKNKQQKFLKNIAFYLLHQEQHPKNHRTEVLFRKGALLGWYGQDDTTGEKKHWFFDNLYWDQIPIFSKSGGGDYVKFGVDSDYLRKFDFKLIEESEIEEYEEQYWILKDAGHGNRLEIKNYTNK